MSAANAGYLKVHN